MTKTNCPQTKCAFNMLGGCRRCGVCNCEPNVIDDNCDKCWNCSHDEGILRWDDNQEKIVEEEAELKPMEIVAK